MDCVVTPLKTLMGFSVHLNVQFKFYNLPNNKVLQLNKNTLLSNILIIILEGLVFLIISLTSVRLVLNRELSFGSFVALAQSTLVLNTTLESISNSITTIYTESFF